MPDTNEFSAEEIRIRQHIYALNKCTSHKYGGNTAFSVYCDSNWNDEEAGAVLSRRLYHQWMAMTVDERNHYKNLADMRNNAISPSLYPFMCANW